MPVWYLNIKWPTKLKSFPRRIFPFIPSPHYTQELVEKAKSNSLTPDEYTTGTITISNLGMFGVNQFDAILPKGTGSILAIGSTREVVVPDKQSVLGLKIVKKMSITLTCDHRQIYGADGALFLKTLAEIMEDPLKTLL